MTKILYGEGTKLIKVFKNILSDEYDDVEKARAIYYFLWHIPTDSRIRRKEIVRAFKWLFVRHYKRRNDK